MPPPIESPEYTILYMTLYPKPKYLKNRYVILVTLPHLERNCSTYLPIIIKMCQLVSEPLNVIWLEGRGIIDDVVISWADCTLSY